MDHFFPEEADFQVSFNHMSTSHDDLSFNKPEEIPDEYIGENMFSEPSWRHSALIMEE